MSKALEELLFAIRQHSAFQELLAAVESPAPKPYRPSENSAEQYADFIYRSGKKAQHDAWRDFLIGEPPSQQEKS